MAGRVLCCLVGRDTVGYVKFLFFLCLGRGKGDLGFAVLDKDL